MLTVTDSAAAKIQNVLQGLGKPQGALRVSVVGGGCSGLSYKMNAADGPAKGDTLVEDKGVRVVLDAKTLLYIAGSQIDYKEGLGLDGQGFRVSNPNAKTTCGCGESFSV
ncbi:MAG: iron-sulfur cluster assembly accessory protein [Euryarchaeota archaeon]|nr:iron-sulfur cluster assembly accessory protein [Euryarchaeota archaeon]